MAIGERLGHRFRRWVLAHHWRAFAMMCLCFATFGAGTVNLFNMFRLNLGLIADNGVMALADGAAKQLLELVITLVLSMLAYIVFKACEHSLVIGLTHHSEKDMPE